MPRKRTPGLKTWKQRAATAAPESRCGAAVAARDCHAFDPGVLRKRAPPANIRCSFAARADETSALLAQAASSLLIGSCAVSG